MAEGVRKSFKKSLIKQIITSLKYTLNINDNVANKIKESLKTIDFNNLHYSELKDNTRDSNKYETTYQNVESKLKDILTDFMPILSKSFVKIYELACREIEEETKQAMEAVIHNFNTLHSRAGAQVPFSSLNFGTDITPEGRLVIKELLLSVERGLGDGETPIFPITVFKLKSGINYNQEDPNYDLFKLSMRVSAKRLFPEQNWGR